jgi:hypothetical protein
MSSFVGDLWKKVGELKTSVSNRTSPSVPYVYSESEPKGRMGPFVRFDGQDFETCPGRKEPSIFRRVSVFVCREKGNFGSAKGIVKSVKIVRHPRMLKYLSSRESESEVVLITEWAEPFTHKEEYNDSDWQTWGLWSVQEVSKFLHRAGKGSVPLSEGSGNLWITAAGEVKVALFNEFDGCSGSGDDLKRTFPLAVESSRESCVFVSLTESFDSLVTLSSGERVILIKRLLALPAKMDSFQKFLAMPEIVRSRLSGNPGGVVDCSVEEAQYLFAKGRDLLMTLDAAEESRNDFMYLLSDLYGDLLGRHVSNPINLTVFLLGQMVRLTSLFTEKYAQDKLYPPVCVLLSHQVPSLREASLTALAGLCGRLSTKTLENDVLRHLARMQGDSEGPLRVQALNCLAGCAVWDRLSDSLKGKICGPAVSRALSDSFPPCRLSGLKLLHQGLPLLPP